MKLCLFTLGFVFFVGFSPARAEVLRYRSELPGYTVSIEVSTPNEELATPVSTSFTAHDSDTETSWLQCEDRLEFPVISTLTVALTETATGLTQTRIQPISLTLQHRESKSVSSVCTPHDFTGMVGAGASLRIPDFEFPEMTLIFLPFVTTLYTPGNVDVTLERVSGGYRVSEWSFERLRLRAHDAVGYRELGWKQHYWESVNYVRLAPQFNR